MKNYSTLLKTACAALLLVAAITPAVAGNSVSQDQALDQKLGLLGTPWQVPPAPPTGGEPAPTQIKNGLPPIQQQPVIPPPMPAPVHHPRPT
jgi:hypothetical protein